MESGAPNSGRKRQRPSIVCVNCKKKKTKCDRNQPCSVCAKANVECVYTHQRSGNGPERRDNLPYVASAKTPMVFTAGRPAKRKAEVSRFAPGVVNQAPAATSIPNDETVAISLSELARLKDRINQIESSLSGSKLDSSERSSNGSEPSPPITITSLPQYLKQHQHSVPNVPNVPNTQQVQNVHNVQQQNTVKNDEIYKSQYTQQPTILAQEAQNGTARPYMQNYTSNIQLPPLKFDSALNSSSAVNYSGSSSASKSDSDHRSISSFTNSTINSISPSINSETSPFSTIPEKLAVNPSIDVNALSGQFPFLDDEEYINFYEGYTSIHMDEFKSANFGPFSCASMMRKDEGLSLVWEGFSKKSKKDMMSTLKGDSSGSAASFHKKAFGDDRDLIPYQRIKETKSIEKDGQTTKLNENTLSLGLTFYDGSLNRELQLIEKIRVILPKKKVIWKLIKRFFTWVYPFVPFLDESSFIREITRLLGPESCEDVLVASLNVEKRIDLAYLGVLLIVLRLAYLSLFTNKASVNERNLSTHDPSPKAQEIKYLLSNPININSFEVAQDCLDQFQVLRRMSFPVLQLTLFIRLYNGYAPEEGDIADCEPQTFNGVLIQMAYSLGLNREPNKFKDILNDPKENNLRRKMWYFIVLWDMFHACTLGMPMLTDCIYYDVELPYYEPGNENISDHILDKSVTESFSICAAVHPAMRKILKLTLSVFGCKVSELCPLVSDFEVWINNNYVSLEYALKPLKEPDHSFVFTKNLTVKSYLFLKAFLMSIYYYMYLHYEAKSNELSYHYLKKLMLISHADVLPFYFDLLGENEIICDMIINPTLENIIFKSNQMNFSLIIKVNFKIHEMKSQPDHALKFANDPSYNAYYLALCRSSSYLTRCAEVSIAAVSKLSNRYYQAWRITKSQTFILREITTVEFYKMHSMNYQASRSFGLNFEQIEEINSICKTTLNKLESRYSNSELTVDAEPKSKGEFYKMHSYLLKSCGSLEDVLKECYDSKTNTLPEKNKDGFGLDFLESEDIDKLWLQMLSMKYDKQCKNFMGLSSQDDAMRNSISIPGGNAFSPDTSETPQFNWNNDLDAGITPSSYDKYGIDTDSVNKFDPLNDFPFDKVFNPWI